ncbi:MAG: leucine-rich repeat domain-containing protein [Bacteroidales bacterium]|nr:leucine-rich repeat domain-containing protein [Bacteroidales bacterium]
MIFWVGSGSKKRKRRRLFSWISKYRIDSLKDDSAISSITQLKINHKQIDKIPAYIDCAEKIEILDFSYNQLTDLPDEIANLKHLRELHLGFNKLKRIPKVVYKITTLEVLTLEANEIQIIDNEIANLTNLKVLNLMANQISMLPDSIGKLKNLNRLILSINQLSSLPSSFTELKNLKTLELWMNKFDELPEIVKNLPSIKNFHSILDPDQLNKTLIWAVIGDNIHLADKLIARGADVNYKDRSIENAIFTTPLFEAKSINMITLLLTMGADPFVEREIIKRVKTKNGEVVKMTGKFESFMSMKHPKEIEKYKQAYLKTLKMIEKK